MSAALQQILSSCRPIPLTAGWAPSGLSVWSCDVSDTGWPAVPSGDFAGGDRDWPAWVAEFASPPQGPGSRPGVRARRLRSRQAMVAVLAAATGRPPVALDIQVGAHGRPGFALGQSGPAFNLAHSGELALFAVSERGTVGVDLEQERPRSSLGAIARFAMTDKEYAAWADLPPAGQLPAFYRSWCAKEAVLKALGLGLDGGLRQVELGGADLSTILMPPGDLASVSLRLMNLEVAAGYRAALAWGAVAP